MKDMRKVGILLGVISLIAVVVIFLIANSITKSRENKENNPIPTEIVKVDPVQPSDNTDVEVTPEPTPTPAPEPEPEPTPEVIVKEVSGVQTIDEGALENPSEIKEVVVVISDKRVMLVDEKVGETSGKMLSYCFDVLTPSNRNLVLFMTKSAYTNYNVGDKLNVTYLVYTNDSGIEFPIVYSVTAVE